MNFKNILGFLAFATLLTACDYQKNNKFEQNDLRSGDEVVYGVHPDSAAIQTKLKYASKPEYTDRTDKIKAKLANN